MSLNPVREIRYRFRLATEHMKRAERLFKLRDWVGVVNSVQLAVENFAKALIAAFEVPTWSHDPSTQLLKLLDRFPSSLRDDIQVIARVVRELAPEHGRSTYGEPSRGLTPSELYREGHASEALDKAVKVLDATRKVLEALGIKV